MVNLLFKNIISKYAVPYDSNSNATRCRCILLNKEQDSVAMVKRIREGMDIYYVFPGGGVENEDKDFIDTIYREIKEEVGYEVDIIKELGMINDYYNLIHRNNRNYYFLCKTKNYVGQELENYEKSVIEKVVWASIDEAINLYEEMGGSGVAILVKNRELPILRKVKKLLEKGL